MSNAEQESQKSVDLCSVCAGANAKKCSNCKTAAYCSKECQIKDWKNHKIKCVCDDLIAVASSAELGRHLIAGKDIKLRTLLVSESPIFFEPKFFNPNIPLPPCLSCCVATGNKCSKCQWPVCSEICEQAKYHSDYECKLICNNGRIPKYNSKADYDGLQVLRMCLSKIVNPELWNKVQELQSEYSISKDNDAGTYTAKETIENFGVKNKISTHDWLKMLRIARINSFVIQTTMSNNDMHFSGSFLFQKTSLFTNSCSPNCYYSVSPAPAFNVSVRAARDIKQEEILTIPYNALNMFQGTHFRQRAIKKTARFLCKCVRCSDKTELGSFMSAWKCPGTDCTGDILPSDPLDELSNWTCSNENCTETKSAAYINEMIEKIYSKVQKCMDATNYPKLLFNILEKYSGKALHENHWVLIEARRGIIRYLSNIICNGGGTTEDRKTYRENAEMIVSVLEKVDPSTVSASTASIKASLAEVTLQIAEDSRIQGAMDSEKFVEEIGKVIKWTKEAYLFFEYDKTQTPDLKSMGTEAQSLKDKLRLTPGKSSPESHIQFTLSWYDMSNLKADDSNKISRMICDLLQNDLPEQSD